MNNEMNFPLHFIIRGSHDSWHSIFNYGFEGIAGVGIVVA